jgi:CHRD domain
MDDQPSRREAVTASQQSVAAKQASVTRAGVNIEEGSMRNRITASATIVAVGVAVLAIVSAAGAMSGKTYTAKLTAAQEVPKPVHAMSGATGTFTATLTGSTLKWTLTYAHLTGAAQAAHIHLGKKGVAGNVIVPLCASPATCKSPIKGSAKISAAWIKDLNNGQTYVNIHTKKNLNGEIRGQIM